MADRTINDRVGSLESEVKDLKEKIERIEKRIFGPRPGEKIKVNGKWVLKDNIVNG